MRRNRLITCSKDNHVMVQEFDKGIRNLDKVYNNFMIFDNNNKVYSYSERQPERKVISI